MSELLIPFNGDGHWDLCLDYRCIGPDADPAVTDKALSLQLRKDPACTVIVSCSTNCELDLRAALAELHLIPAIPA
jgi:hypothetical protein